MSIRNRVIDYRNECAPARHFMVTACHVCKHSPRPCRHTPTGDVLATSFPTEPYARPHARRACSRCTPPGREIKSQDGRSISQACAQIIRAGGPFQTPRLACLGPGLSPRVVAALRRFSFIHSFIHSHMRARIALPRNIKHRSEVNVAQSPSKR